MFFVHAFLVSIYIDSYYFHIFQGSVHDAAGFFRERERKRVLKLEQFLSKGWLIPSTRMEQGNFELGICWRLREWVWRFAEWSMFLLLLGFTARLFSPYLVAVPGQENEQYVLDLNHTRQCVFSLVFGNIVCNGLLIWQMEFRRSPRTSQS